MSYMDHKALRGWQKSTQKILSQEVHIIKTFFIQLYCPIPKFPVVQLG